MGVPLAALSINPNQGQPSAIQSLGQVASLASLGQQQQLNSQAIQEGQLKLADQQAMTRAIHQWDGKDINALPDLVKQNGGSANAYFGLKKQALDYQTGLATLTKDQLANEGTKNDMIAGHLQNILNLPPEQQPQAFEAAKQDLTQRGYMDPQSAQQLQYQGPQQISTLQKLYMGKSAQDKSALDAATAQKDAAQAAHDRYMVVNGSLMDVSGTTPKPVSQIAPKDAMALIDSIAPPNGTTAALNSRTKSAWNFYQGQGNAEAANKAIADAENEIGTVEKETNPQVIGARVAQSVAVQRQLNMGPGNTAVASVPPHLIAPAIADFQKENDKYADAVGAANDMKTFIDLARGGNKVAYAYSPVEGVLTLNTGRGVKRVNMSEIESYGGAGSAMDRIRGFFGKQTSGASIPPDVLNDMESLHGAIAGNAKDLYSRRVQGINAAYGSNFQPANLEGNVSKPAPSGGGVTVVDPRGTQHTFPDQKSADAFKKAAGIQ